MSNVIAKLSIELRDDHHITVVSHDGDKDAELFAWCMLGRALMGSHQVPPKEMVLRLLMFLGSPAARESEVTEMLTDREPN